MKLFLKSIFLFFVILSISYPILILFTGCFIPQLFKPNINYQIGSYGHLYSRLNDMKTSAKNIDVLFVGSSHTYRGFDTRNFEPIKSFNLGSSAQTQINTQVLLKRYLDKINPKVVIYEVYPGNFSSDGVESSLDIIANDKNDIYSFVMAFKVKNIKTYNTLMYCFFCDWLGLNLDFKEKKIKDNDEYISGGFVERKIKFYRFDKNRIQEKWQFEKKQIKAFEENLILMKDKKITTILVFAPITQQLYNSHSNNAFVDSLMTSYGLQYYNFNELLPLNDSTCFYDAHHLNQIGVNIFNSKLKEVIPTYLK